MPDQVKKYVDPLKARWDILTPPQRHKLLGVVAVVLIALAFTSFFAFRTRWQTIASGESMQTIMPMQIALDNAGIRNRERSHYSVLQVDARRAHDAIGIINVQGAAPNDNHFTWENALDTSIGTTDDERRRLDILGMQGQIESQLAMIEGISSAIVALSIPTSRPFDTNATLPSASVSLVVSRDFSHMESRNFAMIIARSVARLEPDRVVIIDQFARTLWNGADDERDNPVDAANQIREQIRNQGEFNIKQNLSSVFDEVSVSFNTAFDDRIMTEEIINTFNPSEGMDGGGIIYRDIGSRVELTGSPGGFEPGLMPQTATIPNYAFPGGGVMDASARDWNREFHVDHKVTTITTGPGGIDPDRSSVAIMAMVDRHIPQQLWMSNVPEGTEPRTQEEWDIYKMDNQMPTIFNDFEGYETFRLFAASALGIPVENVQFMVMERIIPIDMYVRVWDWPTLIMVGVLASLLGLLLIFLLRKQRAAGEDEESLEPQLAVEDLLVSTQLEEAREEEAAALEEIDYHKENEIKKHIEKFVNEKPESVAALLRNWINVEEW